MSAPATLFYWPIKARGYPIMVLAKQAGMDITQKGDFDLAAMKASGELTFGQVPYLVHGDVKICQSGAIMRYICKVGGLEADTAADFARSEMLFSEAEDIWGTLAAAHYSADKPAAFTKLFAAYGKFAAHMACLEKMIGDAPFSDSTGKMLAGSFYLACVFDVATTLEPTCLDAFPTMKSFSETMMALPAFECGKGMGMYVSRA
jgi:glutathione S-transferase